MDHGGVGHLLPRRAAHRSIAPTRGCPAEQDPQLELLTRINTEEFLQVLGLGWIRWGRRWLARLCRPVARQIAQDLARFDRVLGEQGLRAGSRTVLGSLGQGLTAVNVEAIPREGPVLLAANHPGLTDVLTILASVERADLRVVAADYPLLRALPGVNQHFIWVRHEAGGRLAALQETVAHLRRGGAAVIFAAGQIEPDPAIALRAACCSSRRWSVSIGLIARRVPDLVVVPTVVSGVLQPSFQRHPLTWMRRRAADRQQLGATLQVLARVSSTATMRVTYGPPLPAPVLRARGHDARGMTAVVAAEARRSMRYSLSPQFVERSAERTPGQPSCLGCENGGFNRVQLVLRRETHVNRLGTSGQGVLPGQ